MKFRRNGRAILLFAVCCYAATANPALTAEGRLPLNELATQFADPGVEYRGKPFWSWNGELKEDELLRQIHVFKEMGMGGFFMHSRPGLKTEYLGKEWFRLINASADEAERLGMQAWLYDEDRWPSGTAGGLVTQNPKYRIKYLSLRTVPATDFRWQNDIFAAFACDVAGTRFTQCTRLWRATPASSPAGKTVLVFTVGEEEKSSFYNGYTDVDRLNREATDCFIQLTHEQYKVHSGNRFGKSIKGIFSDEPNRGFVISSEQAPRTPWTETLPARFRERYGYDLVERLPELFLYKDGLTVSPVKWHYMELLQSMFLENWARPIHEWCQRNNLIFTGHALNENSLTDQAVPQGSLMRYYEHMDYPGVDVLTEGNRDYWIVKQLASAARQLGQKWLLSELYGMTGWQFSFESHKYVGDWQALFGWDRQIEEDVAAGRLDALADEALNDLQEGRCTDR